MKPLSINEFWQIAGPSLKQRGGRAPSPRRVSMMATKRSAANPHGLAVLEDALSFISSDVLRGTGTIIAPDGQPVSDYWFGAILAARREYGDAAKEIMRKWSQRSPRYLDGSGFEHAWGEFDPHHPKPVTVGSLFKLAELKGWKGNGVISPPPIANCPRFRLLGRQEIMALPPLRWRVKGLFPEEGIGAIYGATKSGKSFLTFDLGCAIASGQTWFGHRTVQSPVTYVILEGEAAIRNRTEAWEKGNNASLPPDFKVINQALQIAEPDHIEELGELLPTGGVIIIDTLNRAAPGLDENSSQDMGRVLAGMKRLQEITGGLVLIVHHTGKDASKGLRGHSSLLAALDGAIEVERTQTSRLWSAAKVKDGEDGKQMAFRLDVINLGLDADGDPMTSCAVMADSSAILLPRQPSGKSQQAALSTIRRLLSAATTLGQAGCSPQTQCLKVEEVITDVAATLTAKLPSKRSHEARRLTSALIADGYLHSALDGSGEAWLWQ